MTTALNPEQISSAFLAACRAELDALKPGNVHRHSAGHGMDVAHFERAAEAAAGPIADPSLSGKRILRATEASVAATGLNTNLGIVLLCAPLAKAASETTFAIGLRRRLDMILAALDEQDATDAFAAIRVANPAGLGQVDEGDVRDNPNRLTLIKAMYSQPNAIASPMRTSLPTPTFSILRYPFFRTPGDSVTDLRSAVTTLHMSLLAEFPDTHISRKYGAAAAEEIREDARALKAVLVSCCVCEIDGAFNRIRRKNENKGPQSGHDRGFCGGHALRRRANRPETCVNVANSY
jgi:triphosphoribosyl-dephospho-CoA synthase